MQSAGAPSEDDEDATIDTGDFADVDALLQERYAENAKPSPNQCPAIGSSLAVSEAPPPFISTSMACAMVGEALAAFFAIIMLGIHQAEHDPKQKPHEPLASEAMTLARDLLATHTDRATAEISGLELVREAGRQTPTTPAWFTFRGRVAWTNRLGTPVESDAGLIVRFNPQADAYEPDLIAIGGRVVMARVEIGGQIQSVELDQLARELAGDHR